MGIVSRRTARAVVLAATATPLVAATVLLSAPASARPAQTKDGKVGTTATLKFDPVKLEVPAGTKVTWTNTGGGFHTVTGGANNTKDDSSPMDGQIPTEGTTYSVTFDKPGTYPYFCAPHAPGMTGEIVVTAAGGDTAGTASPSAEPSPPRESPAPTAVATGSVGAPQPGAGAPTGEPGHEEGEEDAHLAPGIEGNPTLERIEAERAAHHGAVSGFRFFTMVATAFLVILAAAVLFSTRPRRAGK